MQHDGWSKWDGRVVTKSDLVKACCKHGFRLVSLSVHIGSPHETHDVSVEDLYKVLSERRRTQPEEAHKWVYHDLASIQKRLSALMLYVSEHQVIGMRFCYRIQHEEHSTEPDERPHL